MKYFITAEITDGEIEYTYNFVLSCEKKDLDEKLHNYFKDFFGEETKFEAGYYSTFMRKLGITKKEEISDEDFKILKKYITEI